MSKYFLTIIILIVISIIVILYIRISERYFSLPPNSNPEDTDGQPDFKADDFSLLK